MMRWFALIKPVCCPWPLRRYAAWRITVLACCGVALVGCNQASDQTARDHATNSPPRSDFNTDGIAILGYTEPGSSHELVYVLQAPDDSALTDLAIESGCPCVEAIDLPEEVQAGQAVQIRIRFDAPEKTLHYHQDLAVVATADGERLEHWLTIDARLGLPLHAPEEVYLSSESHLELHVRNEGPEPIKLIYALSNLPGVKAVVSQEAIGPGESGVVRITDSRSEPQAEAALLRIKTTCEAQPELLVYAHPDPGSHGE